MLIAAAAAEMHPAAVLKGAGLRGVRSRLDAATAGARDAGVVVRWVHAGLVEAALPPAGFDLVSA